MNPSTGTYPTMSTQTLPMPTLLPGTDSQNDAKIAPRWNVVLINDDYHSFEFVIYLLMTIFKKDINEAFKITKAVHDEGRGVAATCSKERAELYLEQITSLKEGAKGALTADMEPAD